MINLIIIVGNTTPSNANNYIVKDSIPIEYDPNKRGIILNTIINDSIYTKVFFDTGAYGLIVADSLGIYNELDTIPNYIQIGNNKKVYYNFPKGLLDHISHKNPIFSWMGIGGVIGWDFFEDQIIEISYKHKFIKIINTTNIPAGYQKLAMKEEQKKWGIKGTFVLQNKQIDEYVMIDTGNTSTLTFNTYIKDKYDINLDNAESGMTSTISKNAEKRWIIPTDTIQVGNNFIIDNKVAFRSVERRSPFAGLLGNLFLENYRIILDFKNNICYMKKE